MQNEKEVPKVAESTDKEYKAPAIEKVATAEELTREVHYAGIVDSTLPTA